MSRDPLEEEGGVNLYAMLGNDEVNFIDRLGLEAYIHFKNGNEMHTDSTAASLVEALTAAAPNSIDKLNLYGHADPNAQGLDSVDADSKEKIKKNNQRNPCDRPRGATIVTGPSLDKLLSAGFNPDAIVKGSLGNPIGYDLGALLNGVMADNAVINVNGCEAGDCANTFDKTSIAKAISQSVPGVTINASTWPTIRLFSNWGVRYDYVLVSNWGRVSYKNGKNINV